MPLAQPLRMHARVHHACVQCVQVSRASSRVHFSTCHKAKGLEFPYVQVAEDFLQLVGGLDGPAGVCSRVPRPGGAAVAAVCMHIGCGKAATT